jgi:hypothetical protein
MRSPRSSFADPGELKGQDIAKTLQKPRPMARLFAALRFSTAEYFSPRRVSLLDNVAGAAKMRELTYQTGGTTWTRPLPSFNR